MVRCPPPPEVFRNGILLYSGVLRTSHGWPRATTKRNGAAEEIPLAPVKAPLAVTKEAGRDGSHAEAVRALSPHPYDGTRRWNWFVTTVFKNDAIANDGFDETALIN
jgi:hypothetical protein